MAGITRENGEISAEDLETAAKLKAEGNAFFKTANYEHAVEKYTAAIDVDKHNGGVFYSNRAFGYIKLEKYGAAILDANLSIQFGCKKAYYRRGSAYLGLGKFNEALKDFKIIARIFPKDKDAREKLKACQEEVRLRKFAKAIESEQTRPVSETIDIEKIQIPDSYDGVRLQFPLTLENVKEMMDAFKDRKTIHRKYVMQIVMKIIEILRSLPSLVDLEIPEGKHFTVCGDIHGQYYDLLNIFELNGLPSTENPYLFNGDFVDRGSFSAECILTLFALKLVYPEHLHFNRGNHETITMNTVYGFKGEICQKYDAVCFNLFTEAFNLLPLSACLGGKVLVLHGGLFSKDGVTLNDIRKIDRNCQPPDSGIMCELLWSDPQPLLGRSPSKRGVGVGFGPDVTKAFMEENSLEYIIRSHEVKDNGYHEHTECDGKLITVFSAPNYCDVMNNKGAFIRFDSNYKPAFTTFTASPHPAIKPMAYAMNNFGL
eukprot:270387_1